jgi:hypothetical protein
MSLKSNFIVLTGLLSLAIPNTLRADTLYTYLGGLVDLNFTTSLTALDSLPAGTDITSSLGSSLTITNGLPASDTAGFPSADWSLSSDTVEIGTDAAGGITSWDITGTYFVSFPAFAGENPTDFFGTYNLTLSDSGDSATLIQDHDAGFAPTGASANAGSWTSSAVPEPGTCMLLGGALLGFVGRRRR